ncbi:Arylsulfatase [Thalassoglobus neptunius]|uniref:Arylsulfatase n=1 Tax=Thalassoglobus neptunius TaxID=1938619 RepID=A0A5C5W854_9PLAN|nr:arylsulfatase [Thalassoglobus neptunius]TWT47076.1 Arylsulfatase [Thalassoglobus neptunius]
MTKLKRLNRQISAAVVTAVVLFASVQVRAAESIPTKPNIVFILADDMGYGDVQVLNPESKIPTPNLNRLAEQGMTFTDAHTPSAVCTPTRYGTLAGRYCWRTKLKRGVLNGYGTPLISPDRTTVADFLKSQGYTTGAVGKWHLGLGFAKEGKDFDFAKPVSDGPHTHGFKESHVIPASLDFPPYVFIENGVITEFPGITQPAQKFPRFLRKGERSDDFVMEEVLDHLLERATSFVSDHADDESPFFLYFPLTAPHKPVWPHPKYVGKTELGPYGDFVHQVDDIVGQFLKNLDEAGVADETLVIYTSDNGSFMYRYEDGRPDHLDQESVQGYRPEHHTANGKLRGTKADIWEAGHRVPFFVRWPEVVRAGSTCDTPICLTDFFATVADITDATLEDDTAPDSFSFLECLQEEDLSSPRAPIINHSVNGTFAIRDGEWKLVLSDGSGGREAPKGKPFQKPYQLYNLKSDLGETENVIDKHPEIAERLERQCEEIRNSGRSRIAGVSQ